MPFSPKVPGTNIETFSFTAAGDGLAAGVTLTGSTWVVEIAAGNETIPTLIKFGLPSVTGMIFSQQFTGGTAGITYIIEGTYTASDGQVITKYDCVLVKAPGC